MQHNNWSKMNLENIYFKNVFNKWLLWLVIEIVCTENNILWAKYFKQYTSVYATAQFM